MILRKKRKQFEAPSEGIHLGVLADVDKLPKPTPWGQEQVRIRWFVEQVGKEGKQLSVIATYNNSIHEDANLYQAIADVTGTPPHDGFDTDTMIGINNRLRIKHHKTLAGNIFPKPEAILPPEKGDPVLQIPDWYKRSADTMKTPPSTPSIPAPKAAVQNTAATSKPIANFPTSTEQQKRQNRSPNRLTLPSTITQPTFPAMTPQATKTPPDRRLILHGGPTSLRGGSKTDCPARPTTHGERYGPLPTIRRISCRIQAGAPLAALAQRES